MEGSAPPSGDRKPPEQQRAVAARLVRRPLRSGDLEVSASMHRKYLPNGLFPALGVAFLQEWHRTFLNSATACGAVIEDPENGATAGYLLLALHPRQHAEEVLERHSRVLVRRGLVGLLGNPRLAGYFLRTRAARYATRLVTAIRRSGRGSPTDGAGAPSSTSGPGSPGEEGAGEALSVVHAVITSPDYRGMGVAHRLLDWAADESVRHGATGIALVTDIGVEPGRHTPLVADDDTGQGAAGMYDRLGWRRHDTRTRNGRVLQEFRLDLPVPASPQPTVPNRAEPGEPSRVSPPSVTRPPGHSTTTQPGRQQTTSETTDNATEQAGPAQADCFPHNVRSPH